MSDQPPALDTGPLPPPPMPRVRAVSLADVRGALVEGIDDFRAAPRFGLAFGAVYAIGGLVLVACVAMLGMAYLAYPLAAGFALIGPFVAVGMYEVSRLREAGEAPSWRKILGVVVGQGRRELGWMAFVTLFVLIVWLYQVRLLIALFLGYQTFATFGEFLRVVLTTPEGLTFLVIGNVVGAALSVALFSLTIVSFPLLLDRDVDAVTAMITSVRAVATNPVPMLVFAGIVVGALILGMLPLFAGLPIVLPILGHATWRLYRKVVAPA